MAKFTFNLQTALHLRERREQECMTAVATAERARLTLVSEAEVLAKRLHAMTLQGRDLASGQVNVVAVRLAASGVLHTKLALQRCAIKLAGVERQLAVARGILLKATIDRRALELLEQNQRESFMREQNRRETDELDDLTIGRYAKASMLPNNPPSRRAA